MKNLKRIFSALLIGAMALTLLVGCGSGGSTGSTVQYIGEGTTILNTFISSGESWAQHGSIDTINSDALRSLTEKWAGEASLSLTELCDESYWQDDGSGHSYADSYLAGPFNVRCGNLLSAEGIIDENSRIDTSVRVIGADKLPKDQLSSALTDWLAEQEHIGRDQNYTPSDAALHVYLVANPLNENQKAWVAFLVVAGPLNT